MGDDTVFLLQEKPALCNTIIVDFLTTEPVATVAPIRRAEKPQGAKHEPSEGRVPRRVAGRSQGAARQGEGSHPCAGRQLVVYHFMFDPSWDEGCPSCSFGSDFNYDFHVSLDPAVAPVEYNYRTGIDATGEAPGTSVFLRDGDRVYHTYSSYARGGDILLGTFNYLDLTPLGRQEDEGIMSYELASDQRGGGSGR